MGVLDRITSFITNLANDTGGCYNLANCGDFNHRIGHEKDYVVHVFDNVANMDISSIDYVVDEFISRSSQDKTINSNGQKLLDFCKLNTLRVAKVNLGRIRGSGSILMLAAQAVVSLTMVLSIHFY